MTVDGSGDDRVGSAIRLIWSERCIPAGLLAAGLIVAGGGLVLLALGYLPSDSLQMWFGAKYWLTEEVSTTARVVRALLSLWNGQVTAEDISEGGWWAGSGLLFAGTLVLAGMMVVAGVVVRRLTRPLLVVRAATLVATALAAAVVVAVIAAAGTYTIAYPDDYSVRHTMDPATYFVSALAMTLLLGSFTYGVAGLLPKRASVPLRSAAWVVGVAFVAVGFLFPTFVVADTGPSAAVAPDFANASFFAAAAGGAALPAAVGAELSAGGVDAGVPFIANVDSDSETTDYRWRGLVRQLEAHPEARFVSTAGVFGSAGVLLALAFVVAVLAAIVWATVAACRQLRLRQAMSGLVCGAFEALGFAVLLIPLVPLSRWTSSWDWGDGAKGRSMWGVDNTQLLYSIAVIAAVTVVAGLLTAALRPAPAPAKATEAPFVPPTYTPLPTAPPAPVPPPPPQTVAQPRRADFCTKCGLQLQGDDVSFCPRCGTPRRPAE